MSFLKLLPLFYLLLSFTLSIHIVFGQSTSSPDPLFHFCSNPENFTSNGAYDRNLKSLIVYISSTVAPSGFALGFGGEAEDRVNGIALCRGDVKSPNCKTCVRKATQEIRQRCPLNKEAIIWYDNCLFKYSNEIFFGKIATTNKFYMWNTAIVSDPTSFNERTREFLSKLSNKAEKSPILFATGEQEMKGAEKLYGLVQCTRDLSSSDCKKCLVDAIDELPRCCDGKRGGRVVGGSCNFRYELYPFVNDA